ncbi:ATPase domain-containing protein [Glacieibacterium frigidum]|uniref:non-specific serine/threonine protein kinase n=1 Tax=Glacieibacterium frigidum TaxID=2593303 RepID=A0A552UEL8_9SPHN|nr:ATPase domain-containing protein [Glacieibacterium frigidum]TRW16670.1 AAA family ATPase [Glacieibacterium frigidum]
MPDTPIATVSTGLPGLDYILDGGYAANRIHLIEGRPGAGKTTMAMQFLIAGQARGETCLYVTFSETAHELHSVAESHGLSLDGIEIAELFAPDLDPLEEQRQSIIHAADLELGETVRSVMEAVIATAPSLVVIDSLSEIRLLAQSALYYRREILALKRFFFAQRCTVLLLDDLSQPDEDLMLHSIGHGVVRLEHDAPGYGAERRRLRVFKMRGRSFCGGYHDVVIRHGGVEVFPRLISEASRAPGDAQVLVPSGLAELDALSGGGLDRGTTTLILGPSGAGKSTLALRLLGDLLDRGETAVFISFDETRRNFERRAAGIGLDAQRHLDSGRLVFVAIDPAHITPGELAGSIRHRVAAGTTAVILDSLSGYQHAMPDETHLLLQLHELVTYLNELDVLTILTLAQDGVGAQLRASLDMTYLADCVFLVRFFEAGSEIRRAISVIKKRTGRHERSIRELSFDQGGIHVGTVLDGFTGMLAAVPVYAGRTPLLDIA